MVHLVSMVNTRMSLSYSRHLQCYLKIRYIHGAFRSKYATMSITNNIFIVLKNLSGFCYLQLKVKSVNCEIFEVSESLRVCVPRTVSTLSFKL